MWRAESARRREPDLPRAGGPEPPRDPRVARPRRGGGEGPHRPLRHLAAGGLAASRDASRCRPGDGAARGAPRLLPRGAARDAAARRLDRALPRLLAGARRAARATARHHGGLMPTDRTTRAGAESISFDFDLPHAPAKVWRALTDPALLSEWLLPVVGLELAPGAAFRFTA